MRKEEGDYSGGGYAGFLCGGCSALRVSISPPKLGGVRGGLNAGSVNPPGVVCARLCRLLPEGRKNMG